MKRTQNARKGRSQASKASGQAKTASASKFAPTCPALAMAVHMGMHQRLAARFDELASEARRAGADVEHDFEQGEEAAYGIAEVARIALAATKATSLEGAIAKIVMSWEVEDDIRESDHDQYSEKRLRAVVRLLREDAINYFTRSHGIDLKKIGIEAYYNAGGMPRAKIDRVWSLATAAA